MVRLSSESQKLIEFTDTDGKLISFKTRCNPRKNKLCFAALKKHGYVLEPLVAAPKAAKVVKVVKTEEEKREAMLLRMARLRELSAQKRAERDARFAIMLEKVRKHSASLAQKKQKKEKNLIARRQRQKAHRLVYNDKKKNKV